jgi:Spy/CpxP family protein refolding chaperone
MKSKKLIAAAAMALVVGFSAANVSAWGWGNGGHMMGPGMMNGSMYNNISPQVSDEIRSIQKQIIVDQTELNALVAGGNPDSKRVRELSENISTNQIALGDKYRVSGYNYNGRYNGNHMMGSGMMNYGYGCMW